MHGGWTGPLGTLRLQARACPSRWRAHAGVVHQEPADRAVAGQGTPDSRSAASVQALRPVRPALHRAASPHRRDRRRHLHRALDDDRADQPRHGPYLHEHRVQDPGPALNGLVDHLRAGQRIARSAGIRGADFGWRRAGSADRFAPVGSGIPAEQVPGGEVQFHGRSSELCAQPARSRPGRSRGRDPSDQRAEQNPAIHGQRPGDRHAHRAVRASVSDADERSRAGRFLHRTDARSGNVRNRGRGRHVRLELPAGSASRGTRRAVHPPVPSRLGSPWQHQVRHRDELQVRGSGDRRARQGLEGSRAVRRYLGRVLRRVRADADVAGEPRYSRTRPPHQGLFDVDGRGSDQGRFQLRQH